MKTRLIVLGFALSVLATPALADLTSLQTVFNNITIAPNFHVSHMNANTDMLPDGVDKYWHITSSGGSVSTIVIELAGFAGSNLFGVYDIVNPANKVQIFAGADGAGAQKTLSVDALGGIYVQGVKLANFGSTWFGYYLDSSAGGGGGVWYSDTGLNNGEDHMYAYQGKNVDTVQILPWAAGLWTNNEYALAWEDLAFAGSDKDYDDFVVMVESVMVPIPAAVLLGLLGMGVAGLKLRKFA